MIPRVILLKMLLTVALLALALAGCKSSDKGAGGAKAGATKKAGTPDLPDRGPLAQKVLYEQAKSLLRAGKPTQAVAVFKRAIAADSRGKLVANCYLGLGSALGDLRRHAEAVKAYEKVTDLRPQDPQAYRALAIGQEDAGQLKLARQSLEQSLMLDPEQLSAYQDLAGLLLKAKDIEAAKRVYLSYELRRTALIKALGLAKSVDRRISAALALGEARDEATTKALGLALTDRAPKVRLAVIEALGRQGLATGTGPLRAQLARSADANEKRAILLALKAIAAAPQPGAQPVPSPVAVPDAGRPKK